MKRIINSLLLLLLIATTSCSGIDDLKSDVKDLQNKVEAMQTQVAALNQNIETLRQLLNGATIKSVSEAGGVYTITLSNGEVLTLTQGSVGGYITPIMSVDSDDYWIVSYDNGATYTRILDNSGNPIKGVAQDGAQGSIGADGVTPQFGVDTNGYWTISYDNGATFTQVLDSNNQPVLAVGSPSGTDKFFANVTASSDKLTVVLLDGTTIEVPILGSFSCVITSSGSVEMFALGEERSFAVTMSDVVMSVVTAPEGWSATLSGTVLKVKAPLVAPTRATADSSMDVAIIATSNSGYSSIAKIQVALNGTTLHTPAATVTADSATTSSATFTVALDDSNGWFYICQPSSQSAPSVNDVITTGVEGTTTTFTVSALSDNTPYTLYVVPVWDSTYGAVASASITTNKARVDYYTAGFTVDGVKYDQNTAGVTLLTSGTISAAGVYFLDPATDATEFHLAKLSSSNVVIIGRYSDMQPKLIFDGFQSFSGASGVGYIFKNLDITGFSTNYSFNFSGTTGTYNNLFFEDCRFVLGANKHMAYFNTAASAIKKITLNNNTFNMNVSANATATRLINFNACNASATESITITNNTIYAEYVGNGALIYMPTGTATPSLNVKVEQNTFVNLIGQPNGFINISGNNSLSVKKNIFWVSSTYSAVSYMFKYSIVTSAPTMAVSDNIHYGLTSATAWLAYHTGSTYLVSGESYTKVASDPFSGGSFSLSTGVFTPNATYATYGAQ